MRAAAGPRRRAFALTVGVCWGCCFLAAAALTNIDRPAEVDTVAVRVTMPGGGGTSMRFFGTGAGDIDRVKIPLGPGRPVNVGVGDFTIELWIKGAVSDNPATGCASGDAAWITGHIVVDRDVYGAGDRGDFGLSLLGGRVAWGVSRGGYGATACGNRDVLDGAWHHVAVTRAVLTGRLDVWVDGTLDARIDTSPAFGDVSYRDGRATGWPTSDPYLVLGAEKHDAGADYPSFDGFVDDVRISTVVRYTVPFDRPVAPHPVDGATAALYRFDDASGTSVADAVGASPGELHRGGPANGPVRVGDSPFGG